MGFGDFLFGAACLLADQRPSQRRRRKAQNDRYDRENSWFGGSGNKGTCFSCNGTGHKDFKCGACDGTGEHYYSSKDCNACNGKGVHTYTEKKCFKCSGKGCKRCNYTGIFKPSTTVNCKKCDGTGLFRPARTVTCHKCHGTGEYKPECRKCNGTGEITYR